jgi:Protein of unknown function (DUF3159)
VLFVEESLARLLGGKRAALDATLGPLAFGVGYVATGHSVGGAVLSAVAVSSLLAIWRLYRGDKPRAVLLGLLGVVVAAAIALYSGRPEDFFLARIAVNVASALAWAVSIVIRWPLLGVVVGTMLGQKGRWRKDRDLLRAYSRASWIWSALYVVRVVVWLPLWWAGQVTALATAQVVLAWPLLAACVAVSWWVIRRTLPPGHPGLRHPVVPGAVNPGPEPAETPMPERAETPTPETEATASPSRARSLHKGRSPR